MRRTAAGRNPASHLTPQTQRPAAESWPRLWLREELTSEFVTHCQSYQSSPFPCRVDSPPCRCAHGTRRQSRCSPSLPHDPPNRPHHHPDPPDLAAPSCSAGLIPVGCPPASTGRHIAASHVKLLGLLALFLSHQPF